jgi:hypothetical protein
VNVRPLSDATLDLNDGRYLLGHLTQSCQQALSSGAFQYDGWKIHRREIRKHVEQGEPRFVPVGYGSGVIQRVLRVL